MAKIGKRILITKVGMDAHWRGAIIVARALCDAGFEVVLGRNMSPAAVVATAVQEAVDYIGISSLSGNHLVTVPQIIELLRDSRLMISRSLSAVSSLPRIDRNCWTTGSWQYSVRVRTPGQLLNFWKDTRSLTCSSIFTIAGAPGIPMKFELQDKSSARSHP